uniref:Uncharacterized protein n=1 Tax=Amphilophus citrinellus TaxID=61819 RepID=A0A3Q0QZL7_AMPCI
IFSDGYDDYLDFFCNRIVYRHSQNKQTPLDVQKILCQTKPTPCFTNPHVVTSRRSCVISRHLLRSGTHRLTQNNTHTIIRYSVHYPNI